ncbi:hypothetical protein Tdes44962_MAKER01576 [Teratosphaeria destructans]|uniref:Uncharacterized protein n=1 Tax=Teratosphaeria destructans TaxID=418781 RepID=A0A9W7W5Y2_9PEZI|nr:hypothetical protein Tdes44962_MAKER01576 [Teratosphaeria destructans]
MSVTTTQNPRTYATIRVLADYDLHHSRTNELDRQVSAEPNAPPAPPPLRDVSVAWETGFRRVPPHRPINHDLDFESRNAYNNDMERFVLYNLFHGILVVSHINKAWRATGGRLNDTLFRYRIGGEW